MKIHILSSTDRPGSNALKVSKYTKSILAEKAEVEIFSLKDYPFDELRGAGYSDTPDKVQKFNDNFLDADGYLFVIPEYNGGFPGILKLFWDYLPFPEAMSHKPVSLIGEAAGAFGALRPVEQFGQLLIYRKAYIFPERMFIQRVNDAFSPEKGLIDEKQQELLMKQLQEFPVFVQKIKNELVEA